MLSACVCRGLHFPFVKHERCVWDCLYKRAHEACHVTAIFTQFSRKCGVLGGSKSSIFSGLAGAAPQAGAAVRLKAGAAKIS